MKNLNELYDWLENEGVFLFERNISFSNVDSKAVTIRLNPPREAWGIFLDKNKLETTAEKNSALLHECGHYATGATHEQNSPFDLVEKHEYEAWKWAVQNYITAEDLDKAVAEGHTELWDLAEYFCVTEDFMRKIVCWYTHGNLDVELYFDPTAGRQNK